MALNGCFQYWTNQVQDKEAGKVIYEDDVLGSVNNPYAITTPDEFIDKTMYFINSDNLIFTEGGAIE